MPDYEKMYLTLFRAMTKAITTLQKAQQATEETYISDEFSSEDEQPFPNTDETNEGKT